MNVPARNLSEALLHLDVLKDQLAEAKAERDAARAEAEKEEKDCLQVIAERDEHEERLNRIFSALGMDEAESEWSLANDPAALAIEKAEELRAALLTAQAEEARAVEALEKILVGGNHLASALTGMFGDSLPPYGTDFNEACKAFAGPYDYDLWVCWAVMMRVRDSLEVKRNPG